MTTISLIELTKIPDWYNFVKLCLAVPTFVFLIVSAISETKNFAVELMCLIFAIVFAIALAFLVSNYAIESIEVPSGKFHIEATFTDDMPFNAVMKEYNIVEQRGDTFILEPKERNVD